MSWQPVLSLILKSELWSACKTFSVGRIACACARCSISRTTSTRATATTRPAPPRGELVQGLDRGREADGGVDIPLGNVEAAGVRDQRHADQQEETQCQHLHVGMTLDKISKPLRCREHDHDGDDDGG